MKNLIGQLLMFRKKPLLFDFLLINSLFCFIWIGSFFTGQSCRNNEEVTLIRKADLENHNKDGGFWTVIDGKVYDIKDFQTQSLTGSSILGENFHLTYRLKLLLFQN